MKDMANTKTNKNLFDGKILLETTVTSSDVRAYRVRNPLDSRSDAELIPVILAEHPSDLGFLPRA